MKEKNHNRKFGLLWKLIIASLFVIGLVLVVLLATGNCGETAPTETGPTASEAEETTLPPTEPTDPPVLKESSFTLSAVGDILMHKPVIDTGYKSNTKSYNFDSIFTYFSQYVQAADLAVGNLETTLAGTNNGYAYSGYPQFNCPDAIIDGMKTAGFDVILTANNHSYDTRGIGLTRTVQVIRDKGVGYLGTKAAAAEPNFIVEERNGIKLGLACYTYENDPSPSIKAPNSITMSSQYAPLINTFDYTNLNLFYEEIAASIDQSKEQGADAFVLFIHWGQEYKTKQNSTQTKIAQKLCDLGVDVIIGGHPHVVQPVELLTSTVDSTKKTVCLYSMGNAVSNQRLGNISSIKTAHTEDGVLFSVTFRRYSDGTVILESAECIPTWVNKRTNPNTGRTEYNILPLDKKLSDWKSAFALTNKTLESCNASYKRTMDIVSAGMKTVNDYLTANQAAVEESLGIK